MCTGAVGLPLPDLDVSDIQGDILVGLQKKAQYFAFFTIGDVNGFKALLKGTLPTLITSVAEAKLRQEAIALSKKEGLHKEDSNPVDYSGLNLAFTYQGLQKLGVGWPSGFGLDKSELDRRKNLNDPDPLAVSGGVSAASGSDAIRAIQTEKVDGVFLLTAKTEVLLQSKLQELKRVMADTVNFLEPIVGQVRIGENDGREHFGFQDGISQPAVIGFDENPSAGQDCIAPERFLFGYSNAPIQGSPLPAIPVAPAWAKNGSLMVFRKIRQLVPEWDAFLDATAIAQGMDRELVGARLVGRWKSGNPVALSPYEDALPGGASTINQFNFGDDLNELRCPFAAHIRKTNPRDDLSSPAGGRALVDQRRMIRRGIPYGPDVTDGEIQTKKTTVDRGLLFVAYQSNIVDQFEFVQRAWANFTSFPSQREHLDHSVIMVGSDPVIGRGVVTRSDVDFPDFTFDLPIDRHLPEGKFESAVRPMDFTVPEATLYLLVPSITAMKTVLAG